MGARPRITFAGINFAAIDHGNGDLTVPVPAFRKILYFGRVKIKLNRRQDDQGPLGDQNQEPTPVDLLSYLDDKPTLLYYNKKEKAIRFSPHRNLSFTLYEIV